MKIFKIGLAFFALAVVLTACSDFSNSGQGYVPQSLSDQAQAPAEPGKPPVWPGELKDAVVAENLLARNFLVVMDVSGSMEEMSCNGGSEKKIDSAKAAAREFARSVNDEDNLGLLLFSSGSDLVQSLVSARTGRREFLTKVEAAREGGGTSLRSAMDQATGELTRQAKTQLGYGQYFMVTVTDGEASAGEDPGGVVDYVSRNTPIIIYTIGFCIGDNHSLNQPKVTIYKEAVDTRSLTEGLKGVLAESETFDDSSFR